MEEKFFAASNSGDGFVSYFGEIFAPSKFEKVYIIKGGPGTGKSFFMRAIADAAKKENKKVVLYYCSSDQNSLDGIVIDDRIAVLDGTAPHDTDAFYPGAVENLIDLGQFWDSAALAQDRKRIERLCEEKKNGYSRAYRYLSAYMDVSKAVEKLIVPALDRAKMRRCAEIYMKKVENGSEFSPKVRICNSVGMEGCVCFDTLVKKANTVYHVNNIYDSGHLFLTEIANISAAKKLDVTFSYDPICPDRLDSVYIEDGGILFSTLCVKDDEKVRNVNMTRFLPREKITPSLHEIKHALKLRDALLCEAVEALDNVKKVHFEIEDIYKSAMDFDSKEKFTRSFVSELIKDLK